MAWFAAHAIFYFKLKSGQQGRYTIWENVYLIEGTDADGALTSATAWAKEYEGDSDGSLTIADQPATLVFAGIRKLITVSHWDEEGVVHSKDEISYSEFIVSDEAATQRLVNGEEVEITYVE